MKKVLSLVLALSMVLGMFTFSFAGFADVEGTDYAGAVDALVELGVINGFPDGKFHAEEKVTRAQMAKMLVISLGQEKAAELAEGATKFSDVAANHWASGYINVASQYNIVNGYPDGTYAPEAEVKLSEAVTMAVRALGYKNVVEAKGSWPTNYMTKAEEEQLLDGMKNLSGNDSATRGDIAILIWNMLTTEMWEVASENQTDGLTYAKGDFMLNVKFPDYVYYEEAIVTDVDVDAGEVTITLDSEDYEFSDEYNRIVSGWTLSAELLKGNFLKLFGCKVTALYDKDEKAFVIVTPSSENKLVEGYTWKLEADGYDFDNAAIEDFEEDGSDYSYGVLGKRKVVSYATQLCDCETIVVDKITEVTGGFKCKGEEGTITVDEDAIVLFGDEWLTAEDVKVGDVLTELVEGELYAIAREEVEGTFESLTVELDVEDGENYYLEIDDEQYNAWGANTTVFEDEDEVTDWVEKLMAKDNKYLGEDVTMLLNYFGGVIRVTFGEVSDVDGDSDFYVITSEGEWTVADKSGAKRYIELTGVDGTDTYELKSTLGSFEETEAEGFEFAGKVVYAEMNSKGVITSLEVVENGAREAAWVDGADVYSALFNADYELDTDTNYVGVAGARTFKVSSSTIVYTIREVLDEDDEHEGWEVKVSEGPAELKGVTGMQVAVKLEADTRAKFVFVTEDATSTDKEVGIATKYLEQAGKKKLVIDGTTYVVDEDSVGYADIYEVVGEVVVFTENEGEIKIVFVYSKSELAGAGIVTEIDGELVSIDGNRDGDLLDEVDSTFDLEADEEDFEDFRFFLIDGYVDAEGVPMFDEIEELTWDELNFKKNDLVAITDVDAVIDGVVIIRGIDIEDIGNI